MKFFHDSFESYFAARALESDILDGRHEFVLRCRENERLAETWHFLEAMLDETRDLWRLERLLGDAGRTVSTKNGSVKGTPTSKTESNMDTSAHEDAEVRVRIKDGRLEIVVSIQLASPGLVQVDQSTDPWTTTPTNLFELKFNDERVRIDDSDGMFQFKHSLAVLLPEIASDIDTIPENSNQTIEDVAEFVRLALLTRYND